MSTSKETIADILSELEPLPVRARAMFGEYGLHCGEKFVALVCNDRLFLKPTSAAEGLEGVLESCPPYPGAKDYLVLDERFRRDRVRLRRLVEDTARVLPLPKRAAKARPPRRKA